MMLYIFYMAVYFSLKRKAFIWQKIEWDEKELNCNMAKWKYCVDVSAGSSFINWLLAQE